MDVIIVGGVGRGEHESARLNAGFLRFDHKFRRKRGVSRPGERQIKGPRRFLAAIERQFPRFERDLASVGFPEFGVGRKQRGIENVPKRTVARIGFVERDQFERRIFPLTQEEHSDRVFAELIPDCRHGETGHAVCLGCPAVLMPMSEKIGAQGGGPGERLGKRDLFFKRGMMRRDVKRLAGCLVFRDLLPQPGAGLFVDASVPRILFFNRRIALLVRIEEQEISGRRFDFSDQMPRNRLRVELFFRKNGEKIFEPVMIAERGEPGNLRVVELLKRLFRRLVILKRAVEISDIAENQDPARLRIHRRDFFAGLKEPRLFFQRFARNRLAPGRQRRPLMNVAQNHGQRGVNRRLLGKYRRSERKNRQKRPDQKCPNSSHCFPPL